jgi:hypothetical protein
MLNETIAVACSSNSNNFETILSFSKKSYLPLISSGVAQGFFKIIIACQIIDAENFVTVCNRCNKILSSKIISSALITSKPQWKQFCVSIILLILPDAKLLNEC